MGGSGEVPGGADGGLSDGTGFTGVWGDAGMVEARQRRSAVLDKDFAPVCLKSFPKGLSMWL